MSTAKVFRNLGSVVVLAIVAGAAWFSYQQNQTDALPENIASGNGRIEAVEYDIATKYAGRLDSVLAEEGQMVEKNDVLAQLDTQTMQAQMREAKAGLVEATESREYAEAIVDVRQSELDYAKKEQQRAAKLASSGHVSVEQLDQANTQYQTAQAAIKAARIQVAQAASGIEAANASIERLQSELNEMQLTAPVSGRVLYKLAQAGEVIGSGGKVLSILDLTDVYMTIFVPTQQAGKIFVGSEARIVLDAIPDYVLPATVSFVAARTQFTPRAVETRSEREKLMFRVKVKLDSQLLKDHIEAVKTGLPGEAYVLLGEESDWPENLNVKLPQ